MQTRKAYGMNNTSRLVFLVALLTSVTVWTLTSFAQGVPASPARDPALQALAARFFAWRATVQPCSSDDIPRVERPLGWTPPVSPEDLSNQKRIYAEFKFMLGQLPRGTWTRTDSVDYLLLRSGIERMNWELNVLKTPFRNPEFYVQQTLGAMYELLVISSPMTDVRAEDIIRRIASIPATLRFARINLTEPVQPFAKLAVTGFGDARARLYRVVAGLQPLMKPQYQQPLAAAVDSATTAIESFVSDLQSRIPAMPAEFSPGKDAYAYFLRNVALIPLTTGEMLTMGKTEFDRSAFSEMMERVRDGGMPDVHIFPSAADQIEQSRLDEIAVRKFLEERELLTIPSWLKHYRNRLLPAAVAVLSSVGETDDLTSETRRDEDGVSYIPEPTPGLSFFRIASAKDPRPIIIHEGVPGHYCQLCLSWANEDSIRRHFIDSGPIEGWGFYVEEMLLQAGLFDADRPQTRETIYRFMRLRALRVEVDIRLAMGECTIKDAAAFLERTVPMDKQSALDEAASFAGNPGQGISYQIGKAQIEAFLRDARLRKGEAFKLREFHDYIAKNGNVPAALLRWEYLGTRDQIGSLWGE
jgi:hypothetical protein